jgi:hypothetical protein
MCDLKRIGADGIFRGQSQRHYDFRTGIRLGKNDHITKWKRPAKPEWMTDEQHSTYPKEIEIREFFELLSLWRVKNIMHCLGRLVLKERCN